MFELIQLSVGVLVILLALAYLVSTYIRRSRISKRVLGSLSVIDDKQDAHQNTALDKWVTDRFDQTKLYRHLTAQLDVIQSQVPAARLIVEAAFWAGFGALFGFWVQGIPGAIVIGLIAAAVRLYLPTLQVNKRRARFMEQMDYSLNLFSASIRSGHSLVRAIEIVTMQSEAPTSQEFARALNSVRLGRDLGESLLKIADRMKSQELEWVVQSINIHREAGGNLSEMFDTVVATIKDRNSIRVMIRTLSTDGRMSGQVMSILPLAIILLFTLQNPTMFTIFITNPTGNILLIAAVALYLTGILWIQKIVRVKF